MPALKITKDFKSTLISQAEMARALGISKSTVNDLVKTGVMVSGDERGGLLVLASLQNYFSPSSEISQIAASLNLDAERAKHERVKRLRAEIALAKDERSVYDAKDVELAGLEITNAARMQFQGIPAKLASRLDGKSREEIYASLTEEIETVLAEMASSFKEIKEKLNEIDERFAGDMGEGAKADDKDASQRMG